MCVSVMAARGRPQRRAAFTLVELMIVVMIIGLLAGMAMASIMKARRTTQITIVQNDLRILSDAIDMLAFEGGIWPGGHTVGQTANAEVWDLSRPVAGLVCADNRFPDWRGPYLRRVPVDPWGSNYFFDPDYRISNRNHVVVGSFGPNRRGRNRYDDDDVYVIMN